MTAKRDKVSMQQRTENIWSEFAPQLRGFIHKRVAKEQDAEDVLQQVFVKIHNGIDTLRNDTKLHAWLYQLTRHAIIDYYRTRRTYTELPETVAAVEDPPEPDAMQELLPSVKLMVDCLDEKYRQPLLLTEFEGLSQKEMAKRLGLSLTAAKSRVQRARQQLKEILLDCCQFEVDRYGSVIDYKPRQKQCDSC